MTRKGITTHQTMICLSETGIPERCLIREKENAEGVNLQDDSSNQQYVGYGDVSG